MKKSYINVQSTLIILLYAFAGCKLCNIINIDGALAWAIKIYLMADAIGYVLVSDQVVRALSKLTPKPVLPKKYKLAKFLEIASISIVTLLGIAGMIELFNLPMLMQIIVSAFFATLMYGFAISMDTVIMAELNIGCEIGEYIVRKIGGGNHED